MRLYAATQPVEATPACSIKSRCSLRASAGVDGHLQGVDDQRCPHVRGELPTETIRVARSITVAR